MPAPRELLILRFEAGAPALEGQILMALERAEAGGALAVVEAVYAGRDAAGEIEALAITGGTGALVTALADFRLDPRRRRAMTDAGATPALRDLAARVGPGEAIVAVLVEHCWHGALVDAAARSGGTLVVDTPVTADGSDLAGLAGRALAASSVQRAGEPSAPR
jgi:hypothetical protein